MKDHLQPVGRVDGDHGAVGCDGPVGVEIMELAGYFRISLTASMDMIEPSLPIFAEAIGH